MKKAVLIITLLALFISIFGCGSPTEDFRSAFISAGYVEVEDFSLSEQISSHEHVEEEIVFAPNGDNYNKLAIYKFSSADKLKSAIFENKSFVNHIDGLTGETPDELYNNAVEKGCVKENYLLLFVSISPVKKADFIRIFSSVNL